MLDGRLLEYVVSFLIPNGYREEWDILKSDLYREGG